MRRFVDRRQAPSRSNLALFRRHDEVFRRGQPFPLPIALARDTLKHFAEDGEAIEGTGKTAVGSRLDDGFDHLLSR